VPRHGWTGPRRSGATPGVSPWSNQERRRTTYSRPPLRSPARQKESYSLSRARLGHGPAVAIGGVLRDADVVDLVRVTATQEQAAWGLFIERPDKGYSFTDCTSFVVMHQLGIQSAASLDADFEQEGFRCVP
jgi:predicted nucleic acid-binding protein